MEKHDVENLLDMWVADATYDIHGMYQVVKNSQRHFGAKTPDEVKSASLEIVKLLLGRGLLAVSFTYPVSKDYTPWPSQEPDYVLKRISDEWDARGGAPNVPDMPWFVNETRDKTGSP